MPPNSVESVRQPLTTRNIVRPSRSASVAPGGVGDEHDVAVIKSPQKRATQPAPPPPAPSSLQASQTAQPRPSLIPRPKTALQECATSVSANTARSAMLGRLQSALPRPIKLPEADFSTTSASASLRLDASQRDQVTTPKKRAVPIEDVHVRNAPGGSPSKRSRSSKSGTGSSTHEPSTGTTTSLAQDLSGVKVAEAASASASAPSATASNARGAALSQGTASAAAGGAAVAAATKGAYNVSRPIRPIRPPSLSKPTTTRIDRQSRVPDQDRALRDRQQYEDRKVWRHKFRKAFPSFVFYFDSFDEATIKELTAVIQSLGGVVDQFFSRNVTHLITTRLIPPINGERNDAGKENSPKKDGTGAGAKDMRNKPLRPTVSKSRLSPTKGAATAERPRNSQPLYSERNPFDDAGPPASGSNDILLKAQGFGMKVWRHDKLTTILRMLIDEPAAPPLPNDKQDLSQMLEREKLYGTHERDPNASRTDHHYFRKDNFYLLVEDATMEHRPVMCSEFEYSRRQQQEGVEPPWPVLYGELEGRCPFTRYEITDEQRNKMSRGGRNTHQTLRRAVSMSNMLRRHTGPPSPRPPNASLHETPRGGAAYPLASGNSVSITSNIASTTSTALTDQVGSIAGLPQNRRVAELNRRMHTPLMHSPATRLPASPASFVAGSAGSGLGIAADAGSGSGSGLPTPGGGAASNLAASNHHATPSPVGNGNGLGAPARAAAAVTPSHSRGAVVRRMLGMTEHDAKRPSTLIQPGMRRSVSTSAVTPARPQEKRPGYCENCRIKYDHFDDHVVSRKHRKFAIDDNNFVDIDRLILRVQRPVTVDYVSGDANGAEAMARLVGGESLSPGDEFGLAGEQGDWESYGVDAGTDATHVQAGDEHRDDDAMVGDVDDARDLHGANPDGFYQDGEYDEDEDGEAEEYEVDDEAEEGLEGDDDEDAQHEIEADGTEPVEEVDEYDDEDGENAGAETGEVYDEDAEWHRQATIHYATSGYVARSPQPGYVAVSSYQHQAPLPHTPAHSLHHRAPTPFGQTEAAEVSSSPYV